MNKPSRPGPLALALESRLPGLVELWRAERCLRRESGGRRPAQAARLSPAELEAAGAALLRLQRGLTGDRGLAGAPYMEEADLLGAYLLYYWPVSYLETALALATLGRRPAAARVLDLGSGPGPAAAAFADSGADELVLVDGSGRALELAARLLAPAGASTHEAGRPSLTTRRLDLQASPDLPDGPFDAVVIGHAVNELWKGQADRLERREALLAAALDRLAPAGFLLVLEPALLLTSREALTLRDRLASRGAPVLGPCLRQGPCPALRAGPGQTCHGEYPWSPPEPVAGLAARAGLDRVSVKATWFALGKPGAGGGRVGALGDTAAAAAPPPEAAAPDAGGPGFPEALVVSEPMLNKAGRIRYQVCGAEGRRAVSAAKDDEKARAAGFFGLGRYDRIRLSRAEPRGAGPEVAAGEARPLGFGPGTVLDILDRAPTI
ncbi:MAG: methyltransferase domain-containing protein [Spirochaetaceae bacterium]|nr:methyltransferase domain-containing protein [Spirochaetaceae bacterium]